ncbi:MAG: response regulator transcription factor [Bryobacterales bacterium]|nr:response regulator transcription factor [Bryobacterales bacterium]MDE0262553.1 response regulator transcription factor [Bryobacterales bacterium]MDE0620989.1 response regulator transcription factor [Bryobacterales bacterium]
MGYRILLVEDEVGIRVALEDRLRVVGYEVETADNGRAAVERSAEGGIDLIILDLILPGMDGLEVCQELRQDGIFTPVLMLTARAQLEDKLRGFAHGADDYLTKPFDFLELLARAKALLRRSAQADEDEAPRTYKFGNVTLDARQSTVFVDGERLSLSMKEYDLLHFLVRHAGETLARERLLSEVWNYDKGMPTRTVDVHVGWLRRKIKDDPRNPRWIRTVYGVGYRFSKA